MSNPRSTERLLKQLDFGALLGNQQTAERLLRGLLAYAHSEQNAGTASAIYREVPDGIGKTLLEDALGFMESNDWIDSEFKDGEIHYKIKAADIIDPLVGTRRMLELSQELSERQDPEEFELLCTLPEDDPKFNDKHPLDFGLSQITSRLLELCGQASHRVVLFSPFIESDGIDWLVPGLDAAIQRGARVDFVSKDLETGSANSHALESLMAADQGQNPGSLRIFDYFEPSEIEERYPEYTLHAKLLLVDGEQAYIGSANFTENAFTKYLEVGTIVKGDQVSRVVELADYVMSKSAQQIYP